MIVMGYKIGPGADLTGADLSRADLSGAYLSRADLSGADLSRADLIGANLSGAYLTRANLSGAYLTRANLSGAYLSRADLSRADLIGANLSGAYLTRANLTGADLRGADLTGADLTGADLTGADLTRTILDPDNKPNQVGAQEFSRLRSGRLIGYRTRRSTHVGSAEYVPGRRYRAPWFSTCTTDCHPGLYLWPTVEQAKAWKPGAELVGVSFRLEDLHQAGDKWRVREFLVLKREVAS